MEVLIVFIGEFILVLAIVGIIFFIQAAVAIALGGINRAVKTKNIRWLRRVTVIFTVLFILTLIIALVINTFLFEQTTRLVLGKVKSRTGIDVTFDSARGNIFAGTVHMKGVGLKREKHPKSHFDLKAKEISLDMDMTALITFQRVIEELRINGLRGTFRRVGKIKRLKPRKPYVIKNLLLEDMDIMFSDSTRATGREEPLVLSLKIDKMQSAPFRSRLSIFDILFRSTGSGKVEHRFFSIKKKELRTGEGGESLWTLDSLPVELVGAYIGGPFRLISGGGISLEVKNRWQIGGGPGMEMAVNLLIRDIKARIPGDYPGGSLKRRMAGPVVSYINNHSQELSLHFKLRFDEGAFKDIVSFEGAGLWKASAKMIMKQLLLRAAAAGRQQLKEFGKKGIEKFKDFLDKKRD